MPNFVCRTPVTKPAAQPASNDKSIARYMFIPLAVHTTNIAPPVPKEPSTVRSARSSIL